MRLFGRRPRHVGVREVAVPPGQITTAKFPEMTFGGRPRVSLEQWRLGVSGLVARQVKLDWEQFMAMPQVTMTADFHCVTQWSWLDNAWEGVRVGDVLELAAPLSDASHAMVHCYDGYTANLDLAVLMEPDALFVHKHDGQPLTAAHGAPMRLVVPQRYGWKSAKWVRAMELMAGDKPGFWEMNGYHMRGDPWKEERFSGL